MGEQKTLCRVSLFQGDRGEAALGISIVVPLTGTSPTPCRPAFTATHPASAWASASSSSPPRLAPRPFRAPHTLAPGHRHLPSPSASAPPPSPASGPAPGRAARRIAHPTAQSPSSSSSPPFLLLPASPRSRLPGRVRKRVRPRPRPRADPRPRLPARGLVGSQAGPAPGTGTGPSGAAAPPAVRLADRSCAPNCPAPPRSTREGEYAAAGPWGPRGRAGSASGAAAWPPARRRGQGGGRAQHVGAARVRVAGRGAATVQGSLSLDQIFAGSRFSSFSWSEQTGPSSSPESFSPLPLRRHLQHPLSHVVVSHNYPYQVQEVCGLALLEVTGFAGSICVQESQGRQSEPRVGGC